MHTSSLRVSGEIQSTEKILSSGTNEPLEIYINNVTNKILYNE